jgi:hypothetical protein
MTSVDGVMQSDTRKHDVSRVEIIGPQHNPIETVFQVILVADCSAERSVLEVVDTSYQSSED